MYICILFACCHSVTMYTPISYLLSQEINPEKYFLSDPEALKFSLQSPSHMPFILSHLNLTIQGKGILYKCGGMCGGKCGGKL